MFELDKVKAKMLVSVRPELHGTDKVSAMDLHFTAAMSNDVLTHFDGFAKSAFYQQDPEQLDLQTLTKLRMPALEMPLKVKYASDGYTLTIHYGTAAKSNIVQSECQIDKFKFTLQQGGSVIVEWRMIVHPDEKTAGKLYTMTGNDVEVTLQPPEPSEFPQE